MYWDDAADEVLAGDQVIGLAYVTPARGVVITPVTNFGPLRDRSAGTIGAVNSSVGVWKKLERIRSNPQVALVYHSRTHGFTDRPEYVLVQGRATIGAPDPDYPGTLGETWERSGGDTDFGRFLRWLLRAWLRRVALDVQVERVVVWPDLAGRGEPRVLGAPLPAEPPPSQSPPKGGTAPRVRVER
ncbi:MAG TPA: hypothetical protein VGW10_02840, partial [Solirubrobacteraceae bacterium]|nr:hypothetical protein [Solirubrobacteraceae bacterium]